jgi:hypothetical protein
LLSTLSSTAPVSTEEITKQLNKLECLSRSDRCCYVLSLAAGQGHHLLLNRLPANEALAKEEDSARALAGVDVPAWSLSLYLTRCASLGYLG